MPMMLMLLFSELLSELLYGPLPADELLYTAALSRPVRMAFAVLLLAVIFWVCFSTGKKPAVKAEAEIE